MISDTELAEYYNNITHDELEAMCTCLVDFRGAPPGCTRESAVAAMVHFFDPESKAERLS